MKGDPTLGRTLTPSPVLRTLDPVRLRFTVVLGSRGKCLGGVTGSPAWVGRAVKVLKDGPPT